MKKKKEKKTGETLGVSNSLSILLSHLLLLEENNSIEGLGKKRYTDAQKKSKWNKINKPTLKRFRCIYLFGIYFCKARNFCSKTPNAFCIHSERCFCVYPNFYLNFFCGWELFHCIIDTLLTFSIHLAVD